LGWRRGMLVFDHTTLADMAGEYNRYNREKIVIADATTARLTISGTLPTNDIDAFTRVARKFFNLRVEKLGNEVVVSR
jgi:transmembrane sensor